MAKMDELKWVRVFTPMHIPRYLVEQIKKKDYTIEDFYKFHDANTLRPSPTGPTLNPLSHLYVLADPEYQTKGFVWMTVDPLSKDIVIQTYSVDKEYWKGGGAVDKLCEHVKDIRRKAHLNKIYWITDYPRHSQRHGFKQSKSVLMEFVEDDNGEDTLRGINTRAEHRSVDSSTTTVSEQHTGGTDGSCAGSVQPVSAAV